MNRSLPPCGALVASLFLVPACTQAQDARRPATPDVTTPSTAARQTGDLVDLAAGAGQFTKLLAAAKAANLVDTLRGEGPLTVFAPTDAAFAKLPAGALDALLADRSELQKVLLYHVVPGKVTASQVADLDWAETAQGQSLRVRAGEDGVKVDDANVVKTDLLATNGVVHVIDSVLMPRPDLVATAIEAQQFRTLAKALEAAALVEALRGEGPFTVFAPTDAAFAKLPAGTVPKLLENPEQLKSILALHVVPGRVLSTDLPTAEGEKPSATPRTLAGAELRIVRTRSGVTVNGARVTSADVLAGNGVIHVIDTVILPAGK